MEESLRGSPILSSEFILVLQPFGSTLVSRKIKGIWGTFNQSATDILELCDGTRKVIDIKKELKDKYEKLSYVAQEVAAQTRGENGES